MAAFSKSVNAKLAENHAEIEKLLKDRVSASAIGRMMSVDRKTVGRYIERRLPQYSKKKNTN